MNNQHITLSVNIERLQGDERYRNQFKELFGSAALARALDPDGGDGTYDFTSQEIGNMSEPEYLKNQDAILAAMEKNRVER